TPEAVSPAYRDGGPLVFGDGLVAEDVHRAGMKNRRGPFGVVPGRMGPRRREMDRVTGLEDVALALHLDGDRTVQDEEDLLPFVSDRLAAVARRLVDDDAAQDVAGKAGRQALVDQRTAADRIVRSLVVARRRRSHLRL